MDESLKSALKEHRCLVARIDYGFDVDPPSGWEVWDLAWTPPGFGRTSAPGLVLRSADDLPAWARMREYADLWESLSHVAAGRRLLLLCRFPRRTAQVRDALAAAGIRAGFWETPANGHIPPLYSRLTAGSDLRRLLLEHEWTTAVAAARGGAALVRIGFLLAEKGANTVPALAAQLGISAGALRSYLRWMEDAALIRWEGRLAMLRHPLLEELFRVGEPRLPPPPEPARQPAQWDPIELD